MIDRRTTPLIFLHVPKTAGTTLTNLVLRQFRPEDTYIIKDDVHASVARFKALPQEHRLRIRCLKGHQAFGLHEYLAPGARYITMLRDPVSRIVSHYDYVKARPHHYMHAQMSGMSLAEYAQSRMYGELHNGQTRLLAGIWDDRVLERADYTRAIANLEEYFDWIGLMERFDESIVMLAAALRWPNVFYRKSNVGKGWKAERVDREVKQIIERENPLDMELYDYAQRRFERAGAGVRAMRKLAARGLDFANRAAGRIKKKS